MSTDEIRAEMAARQDEMHRKAEAIVQDDWPWQFRWSVARHLDSLDEAAKRFTSLPDDELTAEFDRFCTLSELSAGVHGSVTDLARMMLDLSGGESEH